MIYFKSIFVGIGAVVMCTILSFALFSIALNWDAPPGSVVGIDPTGIARNWRYQLLALLIFGTGFYWEYRRAHSK